jgi:hypothetical protein
VDPVGSGQGPVAGSCEYGDEPADSGTTEFVSNHFSSLQPIHFCQCLGCFMSPSYNCASCRPNNITAVVTSLSVMYSQISL